MNNTTKPNKKNQNIGQSAKKIGVKIRNIFNSRLKIKDANRVMAKATIGAVIISLFIALISIYYNNAILKRMDNATYIENRAFVLTTSYPDNNVAINIDWKTQTIVDVSFAFKNTGKTPAYNLRVHGNSFFASEIAPDTNIFNSNIHNKPLVECDNIGANENFTIHNYMTVNIKGIFNSHNRIFFYGKILYEDFFGKTHYTNYYEMLNAIPTDSVVLNSMIKANNISGNFFNLSPMGTHYQAN